MSKTKTRKKKKAGRPDPDEFHIGLDRLAAIEQRILAVAGMIDLATEGESMTGPAIRTVSQNLTVGYLGSIARSLETLAARAS